MLFHVIEQSGVPKGQGCEMDGRLIFRRRFSHIVLPMPFFRFRVSAVAGIVSPTTYLRQRFHDIVSPSSHRISSLMNLP